eukprot:169191-Alexandrium_andersonii.AAC.1
MVAARGYGRLLAAFLLLLLPLVLLHASCSRTPWCSDGDVARTRASSAMDKINKEQKNKTKTTSGGQAKKRAVVCP